MNKDKLKRIISEFMPHKWADMIEPLAVAILDEIEPEQKEVVPEWEKRLELSYLGFDIINSERHRNEILYSVKDFIRGEFKAMAEEIKTSGEEDIHFQCAECFEMYLMHINEALKRRGCL